ncbi:hypothetical protein DCAR_0520704 [Daucus carota subsp. sativus]|uniref:F-box domain-containing protein n=1 Tax=Daucus carota subsp. sativus TaxID=79200 RepID=A0A164YQF2_DAUCS|nr:PREDICTED: F-box protein At5g07610-like [Daucus carota subsp. sativus]WOH01322.1 hypothetical protein DCAR_0520704 [Daucus carota subsp. sativus]
MIMKGAKQSRISKQFSPVSCDSHLQTLRESAVKVASSEDLLIQILLKVPIKALMGFKCVSKQWSSLITNPHFVHLRSPLPSASSLFFISSTRKRKNPDYQFIPLDVGDEWRTPFKILDFIHDPLGSGISVLQSCNGLLLCASFRAHELSRRYYVYNPTTKQFAILPQIGSQYAEHVCGMNLAFDPVRSPYYKVVCVRRVGNLFQIEIYSSETQLWRVSGKPFTAPEYTEFQNCIYWNGSVHWWSGSFHWSNGIIYGGHWRDVPYTLYFKVDEESLERLPSPKKPNYLVPKYVGESEGHLHLVEFKYTILLDVYEMARDYSGWFVKYQLDLYAISNVYPEIIRENKTYAYHIISLLRKGKEEEEDGSFLVLEIVGGKTVRYNLVDKSVEKLWEFAPG